VASPEKHKARKLAQKEKAKAPDSEWVRVVTRRPTLIPNRGLGVPSVRVHRFRPVVLRKEEYEQAVRSGAMRDFDIISVEAATEEEAGVQREIGRRAKRAARAADVAPEEVPTAPKRKAKE
jgi:hypothetical protein